MKANELRIGNLVYIRGTKAHIPIWKISEKKINRNLTPYALDPIPLTEEWLLKFGFEKDIEHSYGLRGVILDLMNNEYRYREHYTHIESVHQLQNLYFALTGEELEINS